MASKPAKLLLTFVACCGPLALAGVRIAAHAQDKSTSARSARDAQAAAADDNAGVREPTQPRPQPQPATATAPVNPTRVPGWPFERLGRTVAASPLPTEEEWRQVAALFSEISPARWHVFEQVLAKPGRRDRARRYLFARYNELRDLQKNSPAAYQLKLQQVRFEDEIFRLDTAIRVAASPADAETLRAELRDKVRERVNKDLADREQRLRQLQERLDREKAALEQVRKRSDLTVENRSNNIRRLAERYRNWAAGKNPDGSTPANRNNPNRNIPRQPESNEPPPPSDD
jgi:hypothetical protein